LLIIASLVFWNELIDHRLDEVSSGERFVFLLLTGILPFRVLLIFNPPMRFLNLLAGIASLAFFLYSFF
jgi:hypothetical protein